jgi:hypothetical protein
MGGCEETITTQVAHNDARWLRANFNDVGIDMSQPWFQCGHITVKVPKRFLRLIPMLPSCPADAGYPVRGGFSAQSLKFVKYLITRLRG